MRSATEAVSLASTIGFLESAAPTLRKKSGSCIGAVYASSSGCTCSRSGKAVASAARKGARASCFKQPICRPEIRYGSSTGYGSKCNLPQSWKQPEGRRPVLRRCRTSKRSSKVGFWSSVATVVDCAASRSIAFVDPACGARARLVTLAAVVMHTRGLAL